VSVEQTLLGQIFTDWCSKLCRRLPFYLRQANYVVNFGLNKYFCLGELLDTTTILTDVVVKMILKEFIMKIFLFVSGLEMKKFL